MVEPEMTHGIMTFAAFEAGEVHRLQAAAKKTEVLLH